MKALVSKIGVGVALLFATLGLLSTAASADNTPVSADCSGVTLTFLNQYPDIFFPYPATAAHPNEASLYVVTSTGLVRSGIQIFTTIGATVTFPWSSVGVNTANGGTVSYYFGWTDTNGETGYIQYNSIHPQANLSVPTPAQYFTYDASSCVPAPVTTTPPPPATTVPVTTTPPLGVPATTAPVPTTVPAPVVTTPAPVTTLITVQHRPHVHKHHTAVVKAPAPVKVPVMVKKLPAPALPFTGANEGIEAAIGVAALAGGLFLVRKFRRPAVQS